jgi:hypothetical protein
MYVSLLVPLDRSSFAEQALPLALSIERGRPQTATAFRVRRVVPERPNRTAPNFVR